MDTLLTSTRGCCGAGAENNLLAQPIISRLSISLSLFSPLSFSPLLWPLVSDAAVPSYGPYGRCRALCVIVPSAPNWDVLQFCFPSLPSPVSCPFPMENYPADSHCPSLCVDTCPSLMQMPEDPCIVGCSGLSKSSLVGGGMMSWDASGKAD